MGLMETLFIETGSLKPASKLKKVRKENTVVKEIKMASQITIRKIENAYAILAMAASAAAAFKVATLPKLHSSFGLLPVWQIISAVIFAGLFYELFRILEGRE